MFWNKENVSIVRKYLNVRLGGLYACLPLCFLRFTAEMLLWKVFHCLNFCETERRWTAARRHCLSGHVSVVFFFLPQRRSSAKRFCWHRKCQLRDKNSLFPSTILSFRPKLDVMYINIFNGILYSDWSVKKRIFLQILNTDNMRQRKDTLLEGIQASSARPYNTIGIKLKTLQLSEFVTWHRYSNILINPLKSVKKMKNKNKKGYLVTFYYRGGGRNGKLTVLKFM